MSNNGLTTDRQERKETPIFSGVVSYFPHSLAAVARVSWAGNEQHNPGEPLHWARGKSDDHLDAAQRHMVDYALGVKLDTDGENHLAKAAWRLLAQLQLDEEERLSGEGWRDGTIWAQEKEPVERENVHAVMRELRRRDD